MRMSFGKYKGLSVDQLPNDYVWWLYGQDFLTGAIADAVQEEVFDRWPDKIRPLQFSDIVETPADIRGDVTRIFRQLAMKYHPDRAGPGGTLAMAALNEFKELLDEVL